MEYARVYIYLLHRLETLKCISSALIRHTHE